MSEFPPEHGRPSEFLIYIRNTEGVVVATAAPDGRITDTGGTVRGTVAADGGITNAEGVEVGRLEGDGLTSMRQFAGAAFLVNDELQVPRQEMTRPFADIDTNRQIDRGWEPDPGRELSM